MKKKLLSLGLLGFPLGITLSLIITIIISAFYGDGSFDPVKPELIKALGSELNAVILQTILSGILGSGFGMASVIWKIDSWSLAKQSIIYFAVACILMFPVAYAANWMEHSVSGVLTYVVIFVAIFVFVWLVEYLVWRHRIKKMNERVKRGITTK